MKLFAVLIAAVAVSASADTWTMTNGVPITGTVVSSQVATVWIKTPLGAVRQLPVTAFEFESCERFPDDVADMYVRVRQGEDTAERALKTTATAIEKYKALESNATLGAADFSIKLEALIKQQRILFAELQAWRDANDVRNATPEQRQAFVDERKTNEAKEVLKDQ